MEMIELLAVGIAAIALLLLIRQALMRHARKSSDLKSMYSKIILSEEYKVKGRFDE